MYIYIDESGTINKNLNFKFIVCLLQVDNTSDRDKLKKSYKRFVQKYYKKLKACDEDNKMFKLGKFSELKASSFSQELKKDFLNFFSSNQYFKLNYVVVDNNELQNNFLNASRSFNYCVKNCLNEIINSETLIINSKIVVQLDERNEKADTRYFLKEYLNVELGIKSNFQDPFEIGYFDSSNNALIQLADVFSNIYYSNEINGNYKKELQCYKNKIKIVHKFPN